MDAGDCVAPQCTLLKYHELNNHAQCPECNRQKYGMFKVYIVKVRELYGNAVADEFLRCKKACPVKIHTRAELVERIDQYKTLSEEP